MNEIIYYYLFVFLKKKNLNLFKRHSTIICRINNYNTIKNLLKIIIISCIVILID